MREGAKCKRQFAWFSATGMHVGLHLLIAIALTRQPTSVADRVKWCCSILSCCYWCCLVLLGFLSLVALARVHHLNLVSSCATHRFCASIFLDFTWCLVSIPNPKLGFFFFFFNFTWIDSWLGEIVIASNVDILIFQLN